jgi:hypothetical protein
VQLKAAAAREREEQEAAELARQLKERDAQITSLTAEKATWIAERARLEREVEAATRSLQREARAARKLEAGTGGAGDGAGAAAAAAAAAATAEGGRG